MNKASMDNRANQLNPNNRAYYSSRGLSYGNGSVGGETLRAQGERRYVDPVYGAFSDKAIALSERAVARMYELLDQRVHRAHMRRHGS